MPDKATVWGMSISDEQLKGPVQSVPIPPSAEEQRQQHKATLETLLAQGQGLATIWEIPEFAEYCTKRFRDATNQLLNVKKEEDFRQMQAVANAWGTIIRDFSTKHQQVNEIKRRLSEFQT